MLVIQKICPPISQLSAIETNLSCTEEGCNSIFKTKSNLSMHLLKHHRKGHLAAVSKQVQLEYHCPQPECTYHIRNNKSFTHMRYLKQHYLKVHAVKDFPCGRCENKFATIASRNTHESYCGVVFFCLDCHSNYSTYEALMTHTKRKKHRCQEKVKYMSQLNPTVILPIPPVSTQSEIAIRPKPVQYAEISSNTVERLHVREIGVQTDEKSERNMPKKRAPRKRTSQQTQTTRTANKKAPNNIETQTTGDYILKRAMVEAEIPVATSKRLRKQSMHTQTKKPPPPPDEKKIPDTPTTTEDPYFIENSFVDFDTSRLNTPYPLHSDVDLSEIWNNSGTKTSPLLACNTSKLEFIEEPQQLNSSSQTQLNSTNYFKETCFIENYRRDSLISNNENKLCSIETQTEIDALLADENSTFDRMLYSNMCTQTCDEILADLGFNDIETQTAWPIYKDDLLVSTQTQTSGDTAETNHTETQTDHASRLSAQLS